jgi:hypothetical protein
MATANYSWSNQNAPQQPFSSWPNQPVPQQRFSPPPVPNQPVPQQPLSSWPNPPATQQWFTTPATMLDPGAPPVPNLNAFQQPGSAWPNPNASQWRLNTPVTTVDPMVRSARKPRSSGRGIVAWTLWVFAGGLIAGPSLAEYADQGVAAGIAWVATWAPGFLRPYLPLPLEESTPLPPRANALRPVAAAPAAPVPAPTGAPSDQLKPTHAIGVQRAGTQPPVVAKTKPAAAERPAGPVDRPARRAQPRTARSTYGKAVATLALGEPRAPLAPAEPARHKHGGDGDPFDSDGGGASEPAGAKHVAKAAPELAPATRPSAKSGDALDDLMTGVVGGGSKPAKRSTSKEIDVMLKGVQKSEPPPPPKRAEPAPLPPLTASDIATAMAGVKTSANGCGRRFGQSGVADLKLTVGRDGRVTDAAVQGKLADSPIAQCIAKAARRTTFPRSAGLKFDYRIAVQ